MKIRNRFKLTINKKIVSVSFLILAIFMLTLVSYAYFTAQVEGNEKAQKIEVTTAVMKLKLTGPEKLTAEYLVPGESRSITFKVENTGTVDTLYNIDMIEVINEFNPTSDIVYSIVNKSGEEIISNKEAPIEDQPLVRNILIKPGKENIQEYTLTLLFKETKINQDINQNKTFEGRVQINNLEDQTISKMIILKRRQEENPLKEITNINGKSYYYQSDANDNYLTFANKTWRIININPDGSIKIIADEYFSSIINTSNKRKYVGYTYDNTKACTNEFPCLSKINENTFTNSNGGTNSELKKNLESWYITNLKNFDNLIDYDYYCNDTSYKSGDEDTTLYYGASYTQTQNLKCPNPVDANGINRTYGGVYKLKVGIITKNELMAIGYDTNSYLADLFSDSTKKYWTLSPVSSNNGNDAFVCRNSIIWWSNGKLVFNYSEPPKDNYEVLPTITLKPDVGFTTTGEGEPGTSTNPYIIQ